jgi:L-ascorbate metabolism protein UlaG (beta-lactamase superfamily)
VSFGSKIAGGKNLAPYTRADRVWFRRGLGFTVKATIDDTREARVIVRRHGGERTVTIDRADLRRLMAMDSFAEWPQQEAWLARFEADDLVYWSRAPAERHTVGAPLLAGHDASVKIALRDGLGVTLAIEEDDEIVPWVFMPRRGALRSKRLRGVRLSSLEQGTEAYALDLYGSDSAVRVLRELLPMLNGTLGGKEIAARFHHQDRPLAQRCLAWLDDCACLTDVAPAPLALPPGSVVWLGHAALLVRVGEATLLVDPLFMRRSDPPRPFVQAPFDWRTLPQVDACLVTHADNDHLNPPTLARLRSALPVIVPAAASARPYQVDLEEVLSFLSFSDVRPLGDWEALQIGDTRVTAVPFVGEDWGLELAKCTYLIEGPHGRVYLSADSFNDEAIFRRVRERGPVDFAFLGVSGCEEPLVAPPGFGYGEFYALWLPRARRNEWLRHTQGPHDAALAARVLDAKGVFGYAAGGGSFMEMSHSDRGTHRELAGALADVGLRDRVRTLELGAPLPL